MAATDGTVTADAQVDWTEDGAPRSARWRSERGLSAPKRLQIVDERLTADAAYRRVTQGVGLLWRGDYHGARQLLAALARRLDRAAPRIDSALPMAERFHRVRMARAQRARALSSLLVEIDPSYRIDLRRAPDLSAACTAAWGPGETAQLVSLRELLGVVGAYEWRLRGIDVPAAGGRIHPHYGVFAPTRADYLELLSRAPLPGAGRPPAVAFDVGTGTGVLAAVLAHRGVGRVVASDTDPRAIECARETVTRLGLADRIEVCATDLFPAGRANLIVCNPPWLPGKCASRLEQAIYDPGSQMLRGVLAGAVAHLEPDGEIWLILSDLAERLGLRPRTELLAWIEAAGLQVLGRLDTPARTRQPDDPGDPLRAARSGERVSLWRLGKGAQKAV